MPSAWTGSVLAVDRAKQKYMAAAVRQMRENEKATEPYRLAQEARRHGITRLRGRYVSGEIEADEFERQLDLP